MKGKDSISWYLHNRPIFEKLAVKVENILNELFELNKVSFHMITSRTKGIESFEQKISGEKYADPSNDVHDLAGIRIITYVEDEIAQIRSIIEESFDIDEGNSLDKSSALGIDKVGYKSVHYVARLKKNRLTLPEYSLFKGLCFEIQIRTILQHAWAEIEHDRNYKFAGKLPRDINRRFKLLAGVLEIADREFNNISKEIDAIAANVKDQTEKGDLDLEINSTSFSQFLKSKFTKIIQAGYGFKHAQTTTVFEEMKRFGLVTLKDLNEIIPRDYETILLKVIKQRDIDYPEVGLVRSLMIINDYKKYFENSYGQKWTFWTKDGADETLFSHYNVDWNKIQKDYGVSLKK